MKEDYKQKQSASKMTGKLINLPESPGPFLMPPAIRRRKIASPPTATRSPIFIFVRPSTKLSIEGTVQKITRKGLAERK
jgi:hypothetical protein